MNFYKMNRLKMMLAVLFVFAMIGCDHEKDGATSPKNIIGVGPIANAGPDQTVISGNSIVLDGGESTDPDASDDTLTYVWDLGALGEETGEVVEGNIPANIPPGTYTVTLSVTDAEGNVAVDTMTITVENPPPPPPPPAPVVEPVPEPTPPTPTPPTPNTAPVAKDVMRNFSAEGGCPTSPVGINLVATDVDGDVLEYIIVAQPTSGTITLSTLASDGSYIVLYQNTSNCFAPGTDLPLRDDSFTYKVNDGTVDSNTATVTLDFRLYQN